MKNITTLAFIILIAISCFPFSATGEEDRKGSKDHPLLSRMPDFYIAEYRYTDYDSHKFIDQNKKPVVVEGSKYYIQYNLNKGATEPGELKIRRNIQEALKKIGGKVLFDDNFNRCSTIVVQKDGNETWIDVRGNNNMYRLNTITKKVMEQNVVATAEVMGNDINSTGHVSIYGIYFDTGKADIKPESDAAISEIAKLLQNNPALKIYVVGHTDSVGSFDSNMKLSKDRAEAVTKSLITKYSIAPDRLKSHGVSSLAPVATNDTEDGKQKNRRVELVKQ
jgi:OmpA-OmpF porin, OOP family